MPDDRAPDFVVIGAAKSGTTSLFHLLRGHEGVFVPSRQEPSFLAFHDGGPRWVRPDGTPAPIVQSAVTEPAVYRGLFAAAPVGAVKGEVSPVYLYVPSSIAGLEAHAPSARLIAVLREPAERAWSSFQHLKREGREPLDFEAALAAEPDRIADGVGLLWRYVDAGRYARQLRPFLETFGEERLLVVFTDELRDDLEATFSRILAFVGADPAAGPLDASRHNAGGVPRSRVVQRALNPKAVGTLLPDAVRDRLRPLRLRLTARNLRRDPPPAEVLARLRHAFREELAELEEVLGRSVPRSWVR